MAYLCLVRRTGNLQAHVEEKPLGTKYRRNTRALLPDVPEAVEWLTTALPFTVLLARNSDTRCQLLSANGAIVVAKPGVHADAALSTQQSPAAHSVTLRVTAIDELFGRAKAAGARVFAEPADHMYGERQCSFLDPWGHPWTLSETIFDSDPADWGGELLLE